MAVRTFSADDRSLELALSFTEEQLELMNCSLRESTQIAICVEEMFVNIVHYAYPERKGKIGLSIRESNGTVTITLKDSGVPFDPLARDDPDVTIPVSERAIGGLGIFMVKKNMDEVRYRRKDGQNVFTMKKKIV